jgi:hypothetical protein
MELTDNGLCGCCVVLGTPSQKKLRNRGYKVWLNTRTIVHLHDTTIDCNVDKSIKNFLISAAMEKAGIR